MIVLVSSPIDTLFFPALSAGDIVYADCISAEE